MLGRDLFRRVVVQSGSALSPGAMMHNPLPTTEAVAARVNCSLQDRDEQLDRSTLRLLHCLKQVPAGKQTHSLPLTRRQAIRDLKRSLKTVPPPDQYNGSNLLVVYHPACPEIPSRNLWKSFRIRIQ